MPYSRREFLRHGLTLAAGAVVYPALSRAQTDTTRTAQTTGERPTVVHVSGVTEPETVASGVRRAVDELGGISRFVHEGNTVVINPNVGFPNPPEQASTTDPRVVRAAAELCLEAGAAQVIVMDYPVRSPQLCFERSGMLTVGEGLENVEVVPLNHGSAWVRREIPNHVELPVIEIPRAVADADVLISMPIAKCHGSAGVSFSMKGFMGMVRDRGAFHRRYDLNQAIVDMCRVHVPHLVITDATRALVTRGPGGPGHVETPGAIIAGTDQVATDAYTVGIAEWYNRRFTADQVAHLRLAHEQGLGEIDVSKMDIRRVSL